MKQKNGKVVPAIHVYYSSLWNDFSPYRSLLYGIEEEGLPFFLEEKQESETLKLSFQAASDSNLGVGIGIGDDDQIILHYTKLAKDHPLFQINQKEIDKQRIIGANAARMVKGISFKSFDEDNEAKEIPKDKLSKQDIVTIVEMVLEKLDVTMKGGSR